MQRFPGAQLAHALTGVGSLQLPVGDEVAVIEAPAPVDLDQRGGRQGGPPEPGIGGTLRGRCRATQWACTSKSMSADAPFQGDQLTRIQGVHDDPAVIPRTWAPVLLTILLALLVGAAPAAGQPDTRARLQDQLDGLVAAAAGPPGVLVTLHRGSRTTVLTAGVADVASGRRPRATDHMRIASMAKAFSGAIVFRLVTEGRLRLGDTIGEVLPGLPWRWRAVSVRRMLDHTSGLPDYTQSDPARSCPRRRSSAGCAASRWCSGPVAGTSTRTPTTSSSG
jgi:hypothetical protein